MPLPLPAIDRIFARLLAAYGRQFADLYADLDPGDVKTAWCHELSAFGDSAAGLRRIAWALDNLPDRAPNMIQFRNLCRQAPVEAAPQLPEPPADPERIKAELAKLGHKPRAQRMPTAEALSPKAWAQGHIDRHTAGYKVRPIVLLFARQALGLTREAAPMRGEAR
jgi:hypothetical protein